MIKERAVKNGHADVTTLERVLQWHGAFRRSLGPIRVTPLQAAMLLFVSRHAEAKLTDVARALCVRRPTLTEVVKALIRNRWVTQRRSVVDARVVHLRLTQRGEALTRQINSIESDFDNCDSSIFWIPALGPAGEEIMIVPRRVVNFRSGVLLKPEVD